MIKIEKPKATVKHDRDYRLYVLYSCPTCGKTIGITFRKHEACDACGTIFDWGDNPPKIKTEYSIEW